VGLKEREEIDWERIRKLLCPNRASRRVAETMGDGADVLMDRGE
jgi:hypothetical protein